MKRRRRKRCVYEYSLCWHTPVGCTYGDARYIRAAVSREYHYECMLPKHALCALVDGRLLSLVRVCACLHRSNPAGFLVASCMVTVSTPWPSFAVHVPVHIQGARSPHSFFLEPDGCPGIVPDPSSCERSLGLARASWFLGGHL
jgi:hypothetical protein